jgi:hypothetical protein
MAAKDWRNSEKLIRNPDRNPDWPDWFTGQYPETYFAKHLMQFAGKPNLRFLQIGAYTGDASIWLIENVLTDLTSQLIDVDTWAGSDEPAHEGLDWDAIYSYYRHRVSFFGNLLPQRFTSDEFFRINPPPFDFVYIDGSHETHQVLRDAINADTYLNPGGIIAFDDYQWYEEGNTRNVPGPAIDAFVRCMENTYDVIDTGQQVWLQKRA